MIEGVQGLVIGDKGYINALGKAELTRVGIDLQTPLRVNMTEIRPLEVVRRLIKTRRLVETVIGQMTERFRFEKIRARDQWYLTSRIARKIFAHTLCNFCEPAIRSLRYPV